MFWLDGHTGSACATVPPKFFSWIPHLRQKLERFVIVSDRNKQSNKTVSSAHHKRNVLVFLISSSSPSTPCTLSLSSFSMAASAYCHYASLSLPRAGSRVGSVFSSSPFHSHLNPTPLLSFPASSQSIDGLSLPNTTLRSLKLLCMRDSRGIVSLFSLLFTVSEILTFWDFC